MSTEADWMSRSVVDDMREEARSARQVDTRAVHAPACSCRDCLRDAYVPGDDRGDSAIVVLWALASCALVVLLLVGGIALHLADRDCHARSATSEAHQLCRDLNR